MKNYCLAFLFLFFVNTMLAQDKLTELVKEGIEYHDAGEYAAAIETYKKALKIDKKSALVNYEMAYSYMLLKDYKNAIKYSSKVIKQKGKHLKEAYLVKGSAMDYAGDPNGAIKVYQAAIKDFEDEQLLYFNLALTQYSNQQKEAAEENLQKSIELRPQHPTSHYLLGVIKLEQDKRVQSLLSLYYFLLIEPNSERSKVALDLVNNQLMKGVTKGKEENTTNITLFLGDDAEKDEFSSIDMIISLKAASSLSEENKDKTEEQLFYENTESILSIVSEMREDKKGFWWDFYGSFYGELIESKNAEAFCYYISQIKGKKVIEWMRGHEKEMKKFYDWAK